MIEGQTGTGKEYAAAELHRRTDRAGALVRINVAALTSALFESELFGHTRGAYTGATEASLGLVREADGGTLVLDEIGDLQETIQPKLLRVLEGGVIRPVGGKRDKSFDTRFVATTNVDLQAAVKAGRFRRDLAARLRSQHIILSPLSARLADLLALAEVVSPLQGRPGVRWRDWLHADAVEAPLLSPWHDNLRGVRSVLTWIRERCVADCVRAKHLPGPLLEAVRKRVEAPKVTVSRVAISAQPERARPERARPERAALIELLDRHVGNVEAISRELGRNRRQVYRWLDHYQIDAADLAKFRQKPEL